jgi:hypothetical protein
MGVDEPNDRRGQSSGKHRGIREEKQMSKEAVARVVQRAISDGAFRRQLSKDPASALKGFELSADEAAAIRSGDAGRLTAFGVDLRMSKAFTLSGDSATEGAMNTGALTSSADAVGNASLNSGVNSAGNASLNSGVNSAGNAAFTSGVNSAGNASLISGTNAGGDAALIGGTNAGGDAALISGDTSDTDPIIADGSDAAREGAQFDGGAAHAFGALTGSDGGTALPDETDEYAPQFHSTLTSDDAGAQHVIVSDDGAIGASNPGEALGGPTIQE